MTKRIGLTLLIICLLLLLSPGSVQADSRLAVLSSSAETDFPAAINFKLSAESDVNITDIRLNYSVGRIGFAQVTSEVYIEFAPAARVETEWLWDMRMTGGLPPGSVVEYWWTVIDAKGDRARTESVRIPFDDTRYAWQSLTDGKVTFYWYKGDSAFVQGLRTATRQALSRLAEYTGAEIEKPIKIYIYADSRDLRGSMIFPQEWTGGVAFTQFSTIAIGIAPNMLEWGSRAIAHELTHLVIHQITLNPYNDLPTWLDEGLAMYAEGEMEPTFAVLLNNAIAQNKLISVRSLASPFSAYAEESSLAYAESYSLVAFLTASFGRDKMFELLNVFEQGSSYDTALSRVYGFDMDGLNTLWRNNIKR